MSHDRERASELVLALMQLGVHDADRTWKSYDWDVMNDLFERGYISDPQSKAKSVVLTDAGMKRSWEMFASTSRLLYNKRLQKSAAQMSARSARIIEAAAFEP